MNERKNVGEELKRRPPCWLVGKNRLLQMLSAQERPPPLLLFLFFIFSKYLFSLLSSSSSLRNKKFNQPIFLFFFFHLRFSFLCSNQAVIVYLWKKISISIFTPLLLCFCKNNFSCPFKTEARFAKNLGLDQLVSCWKDGRVDGSMINSTKLIIDLYL